MKQLPSFLKFWENFAWIAWIVCAGSCSRPQGCPRQRHTGTQRVHLWRKSHGELYLWPFMYMKAKLNEKHTSQTLFWTQETRTSDVHCLDFETWTWTEMYAVLNARSMFTRFAFDSVKNILSRIPASPVPVGRSWHTLTAVSDNSLFLFGGLSVDCNPMSRKTLLSIFLFFSVCFF